MKILWQLLFPTRCPVCDSIVKPFGEKICLECLPKLRVVTPPWCMKCGKRYGKTENSAATAAGNSICLIAPELCMNMRRPHLPYTVLNTREDRNTRNSSEKKWENIWEILSAAYRRTYWYRYLCIKRSFRSGDTIRQPAWHGPWGKHAAAGR